MSADQKNAGRWAALPGVSLALAFFFFVYFFVNVVPGMPYSADDWTYLSQFRDMIPTFARWNPARVLPEVVSPLMGWLGAVIYAFSGNYVDALIWSHALFMALFLTALLAALYWTVRLMTEDTGLALCAATLFFALAFDLFKSKPDGNTFLFASASVTTTSYYVIPNIFNSLLVLYIVGAQYTGRGRVDNALLAGCFFLLLFLAQFSITFASAVSCAYAGLMLLWRCWRQPVAGLGRKIAAYCRSLAFFDAVLLLAVGFWLVAALMDMQGGRYGRIRREAWDFASAWNAFYSVLAQMGIPAMTVTAVVCAGALLRLCWKRCRGQWQERDGKFGVLLCACAVCAVAMAALAVAIGARTEPQCGEIHAAYGGFFFLTLGVTMSAVYLLLDMPKLRFLAPAVVALLLVDISNSERPWARHHATSANRQMVEGWVRDVRVADRQGRTSAEIVVPRLEWPHPQWMGDTLAHTLFAHGVTGKRMRIVLRGAATGAGQ